MEDRFLCFILSRSIGVRWRRNGCEGRRYKIWCRFGRQALQIFVVSCGTIPSSCGWIYFNVEWHPSFFFWKSCFRNPWRLVSECYSWAAPVQQPKTLPSQNWKCFPLTRIWGGHRQWSNEDSRQAVVVVDNGVGTESAPKNRILIGLLYFVVCYCCCDMRMRLCARGCCDLVPLVSISTNR